MSLSADNEAVPAWAREEAKDPGSILSSTTPSHAGSTPPPHAPLQGAEATSLSHATTAPQNETGSSDRFTGDDAPRTQAADGSNPTTSALAETNKRAGEIAGGNEAGSQDKAPAFTAPPRESSMEEGPAATVNAALPPPRTTELEESLYLLAQTAAPTETRRGSATVPSADATPVSPRPTHPTAATARAISAAALSATPAVEREEAAVLSTSRSTSQQKRRSTTRHLQSSGRNVGSNSGKNTTSNFAKTSTVSCANFFFHNEDTASFGVGTVGLYAAKAAPARTASAAGAAGAAAAGSGPGTNYPLSGRFASRLPLSSLGMEGASPLLQQRGEDGQSRVGHATAYSARHLPGASPSRYDDTVETGDFTVPRSGATTWAAREAEYRQWKTRHLAASTYGRLSQAGPSGRTFPSASSSEHAREKDRAGGREVGSSERLAMTVPGAGSYFDLPALWSREEQRRLERRRLRALEAERSARADAQAQQRRDYDARVLLRRSRKLKGEAVELPDAYWRATYPDASAVSGYTVPGGGADTEDVDPQRVVKDHVRARQLHRIDVQNRQLSREARRQEAAEKQRQSAAHELEACRGEEDAFRQSWMDGRPRISRAREAQRHEAAVHAQREAGRLHHAQRDQARELAARYALASASATTAHQQELRKKVLTRPTSRRGPSASGSGRVDGDGARQVPASGRLGASTSQRNPSPPPPAEAATRLDGAGQEDPRPVTPSQLVGPTSTNFFNEVKLWAREFPSPNTTPLNAAEAAHRRAWKAELDAAQRSFNHASAQRQRAEHPERLHAAREKTQETHWTTAEEERREKKNFATRRAEHAQVDLAAATAMRVEVQDEAHRAQQQRQVLAAERHDEVQIQRLQSKQREEALRSVEAAELQQLRLVVSANGTRA